MIFYSPHRRKTHGDILQSYNSFGFSGAKYVDCGNGASLQITGNFSMAIWVYLDSGNNGLNTPIFGKWNTSTNQRAWSLKYRDESGQDDLRFTLHDTGDGLSNSAVLNATPSSGFGAWYHVGASYDGSNAKLYLNGSEADTTAYTAGIHNSTANVQIGADNAGATTNFTGDLTMPMIFDVALSADNFSSLYNGGTPMIYSKIDTAITNDCVMCLELTSNDATLNDISAESNNGTGTGSPTSDGELITFET